MLLVDHDDRDDEETGKVDAVQHQQEPFTDEPLGDQLLEDERRADGEVAIWMGEKTSTVIKLWIVSRIHSMMMSRCVDFVTTVWFCSPRK